MIKFFTKQMNSRKGFTLIELIVVIAILGILAALAIPRLGSQRLSAAVSAHNANVRTIESAAAIFLVDNTGKTTDFIAELSPDTGEKYLDKTPEVPKAIAGKKVTDSETDPGTVTIGSTYTVKLNDKNEIVVEPAMITGKGPYKVADN